MAKNFERFSGLYSHFNPKFIILQIILLETLFYLGLSFFFIIFDISFNFKFHLGQYFHSSAFNTSHLYGTLGIFAFILNIPITILGLVIIVVKGNKVLDFVLTIYILHLISCLFYNNFRSMNITWYLINGLCAFATIMIGEYICIKFE